MSEARYCHVPVPVPASPVQVRVYVVVLLGATVFVPEVAPSVSNCALVQYAAFVEDHESVVSPPFVAEGDAVKLVIAGAALGVCTFTTALCVAVPFGPLHDTE